MSKYEELMAEIADKEKELERLKEEVEKEKPWEMKCPFKNKGVYYVIAPHGIIVSDCWESFPIDDERFEQGNAFPTYEAAELESKRRNLLTRFRAFRDECNGDWKPIWKNYVEAKYFICFSESNQLLVECFSGKDGFSLFGYFRQFTDAERAIELFGDEILELFVEVE